MAQPELRKQAQQQDRTLITAAPRRKRRETPPLSELPPAKTEVSTPLSSIYPQAKKAKRPTPPPRLALDKGLQDSISSKELTAAAEGGAVVSNGKHTPSTQASPAAPASDAAAPVADSPSDSTSAADSPPLGPPSNAPAPPSAPAEAKRARRTPTPSPEARGSDSEISDHRHNAENVASSALITHARRRSVTPLRGKGAAGLVVEQGAGGVPGKSGSPGRSLAPGTDAPSGSATDADSDTCVNDRVLCTLVSRDDSDSVEEGDLEVVAFDEEDMDGEEEAFDPYSFIKGLPPLAQCTPPWRRCLLPRQTRRCKRKTLVLDLDETLVHSSLQEEPESTPDFVFPVAFNGRDHMVQVRKRPHLQHFLERCAELFEVVVFTASQKIYAEQLLNVIDPKRRLIRHRIFRDSCVFVEGNYLKDLSSLGRELAHTIIIDNSPQAFGFQLRNGIPIESWYDDVEDEELLRLLPFLERCAAADDVRPLIANEFKVEQLVANAAGSYYAPFAIAA